MDDVDNHKDCVLEFVICVLSHVLQGKSIWDDNEDEHLCQDIHYIDSPGLVESQDRHKDTDDLKDKENDPDALWEYLRDHKQPKDNGLKSKHVKVEQDGEKFLARVEAFLESSEHWVVIYSVESAEEQEHERTKKEIYEPYQNKTNESLIVSLCPCKLSSWCEIVFDHLEDKCDIYHEEIADQISNQEPKVHIHLDYMSEGKNERRKWLHYSHWQNKMS